MTISLFPVDSTYPNLALMKLSAWHKHHGDTVQWYNPLDHYDKVYMAKIFTFTPDTATTSKLTKWRMEGQAMT